MASPQAENGHTDIAHEVLEALASARLTGTQYAIVLAVIRKTWGWHKKSDRISLSQLVRLTKRHRNHVHRDLHLLQEMKILVAKTAGPGKTHTLKFNKDYETWKLQTVTKDGVTTEGDTPSKTVTKGSDGVSPRMVTTKEKKETRQKKKGASASADPRYQLLLKSMFEIYEEVTGLNLGLVFNGSDGKALADLLKKAPDYPVELFETAWRNFLRTDDQFHKKQHGQHPVRYWASRINAFLPGKDERQEPQEVYLN